MQDRWACYLLGLRGIDKYLASRLSEYTLINRPVVPITVEAEIRKRTDQWSWITTIFGSGAGMDRQTVTAISALTLGGLIIALLLRRQIVCVVQDVRRMIEG